MKKRHLTTLAATVFAAAMIPAAAAAQTEGEIALTFLLNPTCEFGQGSDMAPCGPDEAGNPFVLTYSNPQQASGALDGILVLNGSYAPNPDDGTFRSFGTAHFAGMMEGCGSGTLQLDYAGNGTVNEDGSNTFEADVYTIVPGGTLMASGSYAETGVAAPNDDGTSTGTYVSSLTCEAV